MKEQTKSWQGGTPPEPSYLGRLFTGLAILVFFALMGLASRSGVNGDDRYQVDYAAKLADFYLSLGADTSALFVPDGNMHYYGGAFETPAGLVQRAMGWDELSPAYHLFRHLLVAVFGFITMLFTALFARLMGGWRLAILTLVLLFLSPRLLGHSLMNPKDIPFAAGFALGLYYLALLLRSMPHPRAGHAAGLALGIGLALGMRAGGLLLIAYVGLFVLVDWFFRWRQDPGAWRQWLWPYARWAGGAVVCGYVLAVLFWPAALVDPLRWPLEALLELDTYSTRIRVLFGGRNVMSDETPWYYALLWIVKTIPLSVLIGFVASLFFVRDIWRRYPLLPWVILLVAFLLPLGYALLTNPVLYDGWRHLLFVYPPLAVLAALYWQTADGLFRSRPGIRYVLWVILGLTLLEPALFIVRNLDQPYVYFNPMGKGLGGAQGMFETDYWGLSVAPAVDWLEEQALIGPDMEDTLVLATNFPFNLSQALHHRFPLVKMRYLPYSRRYAEPWDYGLFVSRFIPGERLRQGYWPGSRTIHTIDAGGTPLLAIERQDETLIYQAEQAVKADDWDAAIELFAEAARAHPDDEMAWLGLAIGHLNFCNYELSMEAAFQVLEMDPDNAQARYLFFQAKARQNQQES